MSAVIELQDIYKTYQMEKVEVHAVAGASFSINEGDFAAISGPSGSGKSTLLNLIGLIDLPTSGKIILNGIDVYKDMRFEKSNHIPNKLDKMLTELRRNNLGFIFQTFNLIPVLNVFDEYMPASASVTCCRQQNPEVLAKRENHQKAFRRTQDKACRRNRQHAS